MEAKYENIAKEFNLDRGSKDFENGQHVSIVGKVPKGSKYFSGNGEVNIQIRFAKLKGKFGFSYFLSNDYRIFEFGKKIEFVYNSIGDLYSNIIEELVIFSQKNFKQYKKVIKEIKTTFSVQFQGFLELC